MVYWVEQAMVLESLPRPGPRDQLQNLVELLEAQRFQQDKRDKLRSKNKVAAPETPWLARQSEKPLQSMLAHP